MLLLAALWGASAVDASNSPDRVAPLGGGNGELHTSSDASAVIPTAELVVARADPSAPLGALERIERAWNDPSASLYDRAMIARRTSLEYGIWSLDAAARAVYSGGEGEDSIQRAHAAVQLAPDLPAGRMALASAYWLPWPRSRVTSRHPSGSAGRCCSCSA